ncbi:hypothetical protein [Mesoflavibacter sp.]|uniref:hypothetical protein n=1 Tax=Mesoflavibacter sp. TaxID=1930902 RepID=UPI0035129ABD
MEKTAFCKHCQQQFVPRRSNHFYCSASCRTKASYLRNDYKYISGHYERSVPSKIEKQPLFKNSGDLILAVQSLEKRIEELNNQKRIEINSVKDVALGTVAADAGVYAAKRLFAPKSLPATKGDIEQLKLQLITLNNLLKGIG